MVQWQQIAKGEGFRQTSPLLSVPSSRLREFRGDFVSALFSGQRLWVRTNNAYYAIQLKCPELVATIAKCSVGSGHIEVKVSNWRWVDDEIIYLLARNPIFVEEAD